MVRFHFYTDYSFWVSPTVKTEYLRIHDSAKKKEHHDWSQFHFEDVWPATPSDVIAQSVSKLMVHHPRHRDCQIVAEAESLGAEFGVETLLSCDIEMIGRLNGRCRLEILRPSEFFTKLGLPPRAEPRMVPVGSHPLARVTWWRL